jgi:soluble lytic murein transglycosylase-like protein
MLQAIIAALLVLLPPLTATPSPTTSSSALVFAVKAEGELDRQILSAALEQGLDPWLLKGLLVNESGLDPGMRSRHGIGIASFTPAGIRGVNFIRGRAARRARRPVPPLFSEAGALDPARAVPAASELLGYFVRMFGRDGGVSAYNGGFGHGRAVARLGYHEARKRGILSRSGSVTMSGVYLVNVLKHSNRLRAAAGLPPLRAPR